MTTTSPYDNISIQRSYSHSHQPRRIYLQYLAQMSIFASKKYIPRARKTSSKDTLASSLQNVSESNADDTANVSTSKAANINPIGARDDQRSATCWSWLTDSDKCHDGIIETTLPFDERHKRFKHPLLCFSKIPRMRRVKLIPEKNKSKKADEAAFLPSVEQARPILCAEEDEVLEFPTSIDPSRIDPFIREDSANWDENMSVVQMHEWLPPSHVSLQLLSSTDDISRAPSNSAGSTKSFKDDEVSFDPIVFDPDIFDKNNIFRGCNKDELQTDTVNQRVENKEPEDATTPSTAADTSFFGESTHFSTSPEDRMEASGTPILPSTDSFLTDDELEGLKIELSTCISFESTEDAQYFASDELTEVFPAVVLPPSDTENSGNVSDLLSLPSFPSTSWDQEGEDSSSDQLKESTGDEGTNDSEFSCWNFAALPMLVGTMPGC